MNESTEISRYSQNKLRIIHIKGHRCPPEQDCVTSCDIIHCSGAIREAVPETLHNARRTSRALGFTRYSDLHIIGCNYGLLTSYEFVRTADKLMDREKGTKWRSSFIAWAGVGCSCNTDSYLQDIVHFHKHQP
jgi:hypothetical protein